MVTVAAALVRTRRTPAAPGSDGRPAVARGGFEILRADPVLAPLIIGLVVLVLLVGMVDVVLIFLIRVTLHAAEPVRGRSGRVDRRDRRRVAGRRTAQNRARPDLGDDRGCGRHLRRPRPFAVVPAAWMLVPLSVLGGTGNGYANVCASTLLVTRTPDAERGRVSAAANAAVGGAQGVSLLGGGAVAAVLSPREIYALAGLLGVAVAIALAVFYAARATRTGQHVLPRSEEPLSR